MWCILMCEYKYIHAANIFMWKNERDVTLEKDNKITSASPSKKIIVYFYNDTHKHIMNHNYHATNT